MIRRQQQHCDWTLDDVQHNREYEVRIVFKNEEYDPGDKTTPPYGGTPVIVDFDVVVARQMDDSGRVLEEIREEDARKYVAEVLQLIEADEKLYEQLARELE
jgi:hypothetical protein